MHFLSILCIGLCIFDIGTTGLVSVLRNDRLEVWECSSAVFRTFCIGLALAILENDWRQRKFLGVIFLCVFLSLVIPHVFHHPVDHKELIVASVFALGEVFLVSLLWWLLPAPLLEKDDIDVEAPLLAQHEQEEQQQRENHFDPYKGQGATLARLLHLAYPERYILMTATFSLLVASVTSLLSPMLFGQFIHSIASGGNEMHELNKTILELVLLFTVSSIFSLIRGSLYTLAGERLVARFRIRLFDCILFQDIEFFDKNQSGELQSRLSSDTGSIQNAVTVNFSMSLRWVVQAVCSLGIIFYISWELTLIMLGVVPVVGLLARIYGTFVKTLSKNYQDSLARASETAEETFGAIRTVRSFSKENFQIERYAERIQTSYMFGKKRAWAYGFFLGVIGWLAALAVCLVLWMGGKMVIRQEFTTGKLTSFMLYTMNLAMSLGGLSELYSTLLTAMGASERMFAILDTDPSIDSRGVPTRSSLQSREATPQAATIRFDHVSFSYPMRKQVLVLNDISFECVPRSVNAFVGSSGGGKSTVCALLQRFYDPSSGAIYVDGQNLQTMDPIVLRKRMSVVSQEPTLFASSIRDNIAFGSLEPERVTMDEIILAAKKANAYDFIMSFAPSGFDTLVGERGVQLSGGQKQRIAIARAVLKNPDILLLDEATSALDSESEHLVQRALDDLMDTRTTIVVAHRLTTVRHASRIFVMNQGMIVESGTYEELLTQQGLFATLVARQLNTAL